MKLFDRLRYAFTRKGAWVFVPLFIVAAVVPSTSVQAAFFPDAGFEDGTFTGWDKGTQTGTLGASITGNGTGVTIFTGSRTFTHGSHGAMGSPTLSNGSPNPYYAPAVSAGSWTFGPNNASKAVALQPVGQITFSDAMTALGLSGAPQTAIQAQLTADRNASGFGSPTPTNAAWITREVELTAGETYTMSWNYLGTDYVPYNDGSVTSLVPVTVTGTPVITVNNYVQSYALLGFTNPGTGDYSTNSYGATGWQTSTYEVSITGTYKLGFAVFNLGDTSLSPVLMVDSEAGSTERCASGTCTTFGGVEPNNETAPTAPPTTVAETTTTSTTSTTTTTTTTLPPAPTSLVVTSLDDTTSSGTLRWAITEANATSGGIYDSITFDINGTITLTSALPQISQNLTVTGNGRTNTVIDGNNAYRIFHVQSGKSLTVSDMTLKQGQSTNGGLIYNSQGTVVATNIRFTAMSGGSAVWNNNGGSTATYTNCTFDYLNNGIAGDYGSTPQLAAGTTTWANEPDSVFGNKTYVNNCIFDHNNAGIYNYRFTKVVNSTFTHNNYAANVTGLNRTQILNSTFDNNQIAIYHNAWIPTTFNMGTDNRLIDGNTFTNNSMAIYLDDGYNNGQKTPRWATVTNNSFDENGTWITYYLWNGTSNVSGNVAFNEATELFVHSFNASVATSTTTTTTTTIPQTTTTENQVDNTTTTTTEAPAPQTTTTTEPVAVVVPVETVPETTVPEETTTTTEETIPTETTIEDIATTTEPETTTITTEPPVEDVATTTPDETTEFTDEEISNIIDSIDTTSSEEVAAVLDDIFTSDISAEQLTEVLDAVFTADVEAEVLVAALDAVLSADISTEEFAAVLDAVFDEPLSDEQFTAVIDSVITEDITDEQFAEVLNVLESDTVSEEQVAEAVDAVLENGVTESQATDLASSSKVLESIDTTQAEAVFETIPVGDLTQAEEAALVAAVTNAPQEIKETFEETIDIYGEGLDDYVAVGSQVDVGSRRTLIAASTAVAAVAGAAATGGPSGGSTGGSGGSSGGGSGGSNTEGRSRREEEGEEPAGEIAGPEDDDDEEYTRNSIFNYYLEEGIWKKKVSWLGLVRKFVNETAALSFTLAGSVVVFITLSGDTRKTAMIATGVALAVHYVHVLLKNDEA